MSRVAVRDLTKIFAPEVKPVDAISFDVEDHGFLTLLGPSGCGKSTVLRMIAGLESATRGEISIGGHAGTDLPPAQRNVAMVFQSYTLYPHMKCFRNIAANLKMR